MAMNGIQVQTMQQKFCPFIMKACIGNECALWMRYDRHDGVAIESCTFVLGPMLQQQGIIEQIRTQATNDKVATSVREGFGVLVAMAHKARQGVLRDAEADSKV